MLTYAPTGALVAAPTTSLPEEVGGVRNWDYRYCWLRDACFTLHALAGLGYSGEARAFGDYLAAACARTAPDVRIMYGIGLETELHERELTHLSGYRGSRPVRVGNDAHRQRQIDVFGEVIDWGLLTEALGRRLDAGARKLIEDLVDQVARRWREPDSGFWEIRDEPRHHVHGRMMSWVAVDRAIRILGRRPAWLELRERILREVLECGIVDGRLVQAYGADRADATLLLAPMLGFPVAGEVFARTVDAVQRELGAGGYLLRYRCADGLPGGEGAFLMCSFWLVDALLWLDRPAEAREIYERLLASGNDVGLLPEQIDPACGAFLGNFPQAFTHLALVNSALHFELYEKGGAAALRGSYADRARRGVLATYGWRGMLAAALRTGRIGRLRSSRRSIFADLAAEGIPPRSA